MLMLPDYKVRQRDFLLEISRAITEQLDLGEVLRRVLKASVAMLAGQVGLIGLRDAHGIYKIRAALGVDEARIPQLNEQLQDLIAGVEAGSEQDVLEIKMQGILETLGMRLRQYIALPLVFADEPLGLLIVFRSYYSRTDRDDIQVLQSFADQAAIAVNNAQLYERIDHERKQLAAIVQHSADGVMILDANGYVLIFNAALEHMTAVAAGDAIGSHHDEVVTWARLESSDLTAALEDGWPFRRAVDAPTETLYVEGDLLRQDGMTLSIGITYAPLISSDGKLTNIIANVRDISNFRRSQEMQNTFISTVSHELKTPVALIKGYAGTLRRDDAAWDGAVVRDSLGVIEEEADRLTLMIDDLLTASKLQAQRTVQLDIGDVRLDELAARSVERFRTQTSIHNFTLSFAPDFPLIQGDEVRLRQVVENLISNAIKYSPDGGTIEVGGMIEGNDVKFYIRDQGIGLSGEEQARVFERFYRADSALRRQTQGTGLGLYLTRALIEAHGGSIHVDSQPGQGTTFYFKLPL